MAEESEDFKNLRKEYSPQEWEDMIMGPKDKWTREKEDEKSLSIEVMMLQATFIGTDSLGYRYGHTYNLKVRVLHTSKIEIRNFNNTGFCPYDSWFAFFRNWGNVNITGPGERIRFYRGNQFP